MRYDLFLSSHSITGNIFLVFALGRSQNQKPSLLCFVGHTKQGSHFDSSKGPSPIASCDLPGIPPQKACLAHCPALLKFFLLTIKAPIKVIMRVFMMLLIQTQMPSVGGGQSPLYGSVEFYSNLWQSISKMVTKLVKHVLQEILKEVHQAEIKYSQMVI